MFVSQHRAHRWEVKTNLDTKVSSIDVVSQEEITSLRGITTDLEQLHQVEILSVDVSAHSDRCIHFKEVVLALQYFCPKLNDP